MNDHHALCGCPECSKHADWLRSQKPPQSGIAPLSKETSPVRFGFSPSPRIKPMPNRYKEARPLVEHTCIHCGAQWRGLPLSGPVQCAFCRGSSIHPANPVLSQPQARVLLAELYAPLPHDRHDGEPFGGAAGKAKLTRKIKRELRKGFTL